MSIVLGISCVFAVLAGLVHVYAFVLQSLSWTSERTRRLFGIADEAEARATRVLAFNQGFYNLFLAIGAILGVVLVATGSEATGWSLVVFTCACMVGAAVVLGGTGRRYLSSALRQGAFPLIALVFAFVGSLLH
jgi:putative membrane protein